jgi:hypothetical protein
LSPAALPLPHAHPHPSPHPTPPPTHPSPHPPSAPGCLIPIFLSCAWLSSLLAYPQQKFFFARECLIFPCATGPFSVRVGFSCRQRQKFCSYLLFYFVVTTRTIPLRPAAVDSFYSSVFLSSRLRVALTRAGFCCFVVATCQTFLRHTECLIHLSPTVEFSSCSRFANGLVFLLSVQFFFSLGLRARECLILFNFRVPTVQIFIALVRQGYYVLRVFFFDLSRVSHGSQLAFLTHECLIMFHFVVAQVHLFSTRSIQRMSVALSLQGTSAYRK